jgi:hypothetical protein
MSGMFKQSVFDTTYLSQVFNTSSTSDSYFIRDSVLLGYYHAHKRWVEVWVVFVLAAIAIACGGEAMTGSLCL